MTWQVTWWGVLLTRALQQHKRQLEKGKSRLVMLMCYCAVVVCCCVDGQQARKVRQNKSGSGQGCGGALPLLPAGSDEVGQVAWVVCQENCEGAGLIGRKQAMPALTLRCTQGAVVDHVSGVLNALSTMRANAHLTGLWRPQPPARLLCQPMGAGAQLRQRFPPQPQPRVLQVHLGPD